MDPQGKKPASLKKKYRPKVRSDVGGSSQRSQRPQFSPTPPSHFSPSPPFHHPSFPDNVYPFYHQDPSMPVQIAPGTFRLPVERPPSDVFSRYRDPNEPYYNQPFRSPVQRNEPAQGNEPPVVDLDEQFERAQDEAYDDVNDTESEDESPDDASKEPVPTTRAKPIQWTPDDEECLAKAYFHISTDPLVGDAQKHESFYRRVTSHYHTLQSRHTRTVHQINTKWKNMQPRLKEFNGIFAKLKHTWGSGRDDDDILKMALEQWAEGHKNKPFPHLKAWEIARFQQKFDYVPPVGGLPGGSESGSDKRARTSESGNYQTAVPDLNEDSMPTLPTRKGKNKADSSTGKSRLSIHDSLEEYKSWKAEEKEERRQREAEKMALFVEREELTKKMLQQQLEVQTQAQMDREMKFFVEPHEHLAPPMRELMYQRKLQIAAKYNWPAPNP